MHISETGQNIVAQSHTNTPNITEYYHDKFEAKINTKKPKTKLSQSTVTSADMRVHTPLCTTVVHNSAKHSSDNLPHTSR